MRRSALRIAARAAGALLFVGVTVALAKVSQYAMVERLGPTIGFDAASFIGAVPVVIVAALLERRWRSRSDGAASDHASR